jgi:hypothetical protein
MELSILLVYLGAELLLQLAARAYAYVEFPL